MERFKSSTSQSLLFLGLIVFLLFIFSATVFTVFNKNPKSPQTDTGNSTARAVPTTNPQKTIQLGTLDFTSPTPKPTSIPLVPPVSAPKVCGIAIKFGTIIDTASCCVRDGPVDDISQCCSGIPTCKDIQDHPEIYQDRDKNNGSVYKCSLPPGQAANWCDAKPVIYLYPTQKMQVDVSVQVPGEIIESIPLYPTGGWRNVIAYPGGKLEYSGKEYSELFYEASVTPIHAPAEGYVVAKKDLKTFLFDFTYRLGLEKKEQDEFLQYWIPRLQQERAPYIFISMFGASEKKVIDNVVITPAPDTFIEFIAYFKPVETFYTPNPLHFDSRPKRQGFTAVEWGGIVDR